MRRRRRQVSNRLRKKKCEQHCNDDRCDAADDQIVEDAGDHDDDRDDDSDGVVSATRQYERYHGEDADNESSA